MCFRKNIVVVVLFIVSFINVNAEQGVDLSIVSGQSKNQPELTIFEGSVYEPYNLDDSDVKFTLRTERVIYTLPVGSFVKGPVLSSDGAIIKKGDIVGKVDSRYHENELKLAKAEVKSTKAVLFDVNTTLQRKEKLVKRNIVSREELDAAKSKYLVAKYNYEKALSNELYMQYAYNQCTIRAPYDGVISEVFLKPGAWANVDFPILRISKLSPINIYIKMQPEIARKILIGEVPILVYPIGVEKPVGIISNSLRAKDEGITFSIENDPRKNENKFDLPVVNEITYVQKFKQIGSYANNICVRKEAVVKDGDQYFVWSAKGQKEAQAGKIIAKQFKIERVPVIPLDLLRNYVYCALDDSTKLKEYDVVLLNPSDKLKDGDTVAYEKMKYLFMPSQTVKVAIPLPAVQT